MRKRRGVVVLLLAGGIIASACSGTTSGGSAGLPPGVHTLSNFEHQISRDIEKWHWTHSVSSVNCVMPNMWQSGAVFTCFVYQDNGNGLGEIKGVVLPNVHHRWDANLTWKPVN